MGKPEFDITQATLRYALQCMHNGNWPVLRDMGFGPRECEALAELTLAELIALEQRMSCRILKVELDSAVFWQALEDLEHDTTEQSVLYELIKRDAPAQMMGVLYGMGEKTYTRLRRRLAVSAGVGRPAELSLDAVYALSEILTRFDLPLSPADWLVTAEETGLSLRAIWRAYRHWQTAPVCGTSDPHERDRP